MKKILMTWAAVLCCAMTMTMFTACTDNDDNPVTPPEPEKELAECTIMWYGSGGGNVDSKILNNFRQFYRAKPETYDHVNIVAQYKVSATLLKGFDERILKLMEEDLKQYEGMTDEELENPEIVNSSDYFSLCPFKRFGSCAEGVYRPLGRLESLAAHQRIGTTSLESLVVQIQST